MSGLVAWLDGADTSTMFNNTSGGSLPSVGSAIARWEDKSGNSRHVLQATGVAQPLRGSGGAVTFDGSDDRLTTSLTFALPAFTSFVVARLTGVGTATTPRFWDYDFNSSTGTARAHFAEYSANKRMRLSANTGSTLSRLGSATIALNQTYLTTGTWDGTNNGTGMSLRLNAETDDGTAASATADAVSTQKLSVGNSIAANRGLLGSIYEIVLFNRVLSAREIEQVESYLAVKWGVSAVDYSSSSSSSVL